ncbi:hypothetical protein [Ramlibacter sp.]|uniref:hypothetical protein n=1 Tax=Ramlibacter sp. TaxID=1917967 RepID=UPI002FCA5675
MNATELRAVHKLTKADVLQSSIDRRLFRVTGIERASDEADARCKVFLRSLDETVTMMMVRAGRELIRTVPRAQLLPTAGIALVTQV